MYSRVKSVAVYYIKEFVPMGVPERRFGQLLAR
jgi:hypothetical protein